MLHTDVSTYECIIFMGIDIFIRTYRCIYIVCVNEQESYQTILHVIAFPGWISNQPPEYYKNRRDEVWDLDALCYNNAMRHSAQEK